MFGFQWLTASVLYVASSGIVALLIALEGLMLKKNAGKIPKSLIFHICSLIDTVWFFVSVTVIYILDMPSLLLSVPIAYCLYSIGGWIYSSRMLRKEGVPESIKDLVIPNAYIAYSQAFALVYFSLNIFMLLTIFEYVSLDLV